MPPNPGWKLPNTAGNLLSWHDKRAEPGYSLATSDILNMFPDQPELFEGSDAGSDRPGREKLQPNVSLVGKRMRACSLDKLGMTTILRLRHRSAKRALQSVLSDLRSSSNKAKEGVCTPLSSFCK